MKKFDIDLEKINGLLSILRADMSLAQIGTERSLNG